MVERLVQPLVLGVGAFGVMTTLPTVWPVLLDTVLIPAWQVLSAPWSLSRLETITLWKFTKVLESKFCLCRLLTYLDISEHLAPRTLVMYPEVLSPVMKSSASPVARVCIVLMARLKCVPTYAPRCRRVVTILLLSVVLRHTFLFILVILVSPV